MSLPLVDVCDLTACTGVTALSLSSFCHQRRLDGSDSQTSHERQTQASTPPGIFTCSFHLNNAKIRFSLAPPSRHQNQTPPKLVFGDPALLRSQASIFLILSLTHLDPCRSPTAYILEPGLCVLVLTCACPVSGSLLTCAALSDRLSEISPGTPGESGPPGHSVSSLIVVAELRQYSLRLSHSLFLLFEARLSAAAKVLAFGLLPCPHYLKHWRSQ